MCCAVSFESDRLIMIFVDEMLAGRKELQGGSERIQVDSMEDSPLSLVDSASSGSD